MLEAGDPASIIAATVFAPVSVEALRARGLLSASELEAALATVARAGDWAFAPAWLEETSDAVVARLQARAEESPLEPGLAATAELLPAEPWAAAILPLLPIERRGGTRISRASSGRSVREGRLLPSSIASSAKLAWPRSGRRRRATRFLEAEGRVVRLGDGFVVSAAAYEGARGLVVGECRSAGEITLARFRDLAGIGRRDAQLLLERLDQDGVTRRLGDRRVLRRVGRDD